jgi:hypothetical protein
MNEEPNVLHVRRYLLLYLHHYLLIALSFEAAPVSNTYYVPLFACVMSGAD